MIIKADKEGKGAIESLVNVALKSGAIGIDSLQPLLIILQTIEEIEEDEIITKRSKCSKE